MLSGQLRALTHAVALKKQLKGTGFLLCGLRDKYWFPFILGLFLPGSRLKLVSGRKAWLYWRSFCFTMKVFVCWLSHNKPILCSLMTFPFEDLKTLWMHQKDLTHSYNAFWLWPKLGKCCPVWQFLLLFLLDRQISEVQGQDLGLQRWGLHLGCLGDHVLKLTSIRHLWAESPSEVVPPKLWKKNSYRGMSRSEWRGQYIWAAMQTHLGSFGGKNWSQTRASMMLSITSSCFTPNTSTEEKQDEISSRLGPLCMVWCFLGLQLA